MSEWSISAVLKDGSLEESLTGICIRPRRKALVAFSIHSEAMRCIAYFHGQCIGGAETPISAIYVRTVKKDTAFPSKQPAGSLSGDAPPFVPSWLRSEDAPASPVKDGRDDDEINRCCSFASTSLQSDTIPSDGSCSES